MSALNRHALNVLDARPDDAAAVLDVVRRSFAARPPLDPPSTAADETVETVAEALEAAGGLLVERRGKPIGAMIFDASRPGLLGFRRVSVDPDHQDRGVASAMVGVGEDTAEERGVDGIWLHVREELPETIEFWTRRRYHRVAHEGQLLELGKTLWIAREAHTASETFELGCRLARLLGPGDLVVMSGALGAGKTTFTQGLADGLGVRGPITSPTFVIAREHPSLGDGPGLVHVDAYRLDDVAEVDDLDLDASLDSSVTVVEWGSGMAEQLSESWVHVRLERRRGDVMDPIGVEAPADAPGAGDDTRVVTIKTHGPRWARTPLRSTILGG